MPKKIEVDFMHWHMMKNALEDMQGHTFYCEDADGLLRRWTPPRVPNLVSTKAKEPTDV